MSYIFIQKRYICSISFLLRFNNTYWLAAAINDSAFQKQSCVRPQTTAMAYHPVSRMPVCHRRDIKQLQTVVYRKSLTDSLENVLTAILNRLLSRFLPNLNQKALEQLNSKIKPVWFLRSQRCLHTKKNLQYKTQAKTQRHLLFERRYWNHQVNNGEYNWQSCCLWHCRIPCKNGTVESVYSR